MRKDRINNVTAGKVEVNVSEDGKCDIYKADHEVQLRACEANVRVKKV